MVENKMKSFKQHLKEAYSSSKGETHPDKGDFDSTKKAHAAAHHIVTEPRRNIDADYGNVRAVYNKDGSAHVHFRGSSGNYGHYAHVSAKTHSEILHHNKVPHTHKDKSNVIHIHAH